MTDTSERPPSGLSREFEFDGHVVQDMNRQEPTTISYGPKNDGQQQWADLPPDELAQAVHHYTRMTDNREESGYVPPLPSEPVPVRGRAPVYVEPLGYAEAAGAGGGPGVDASSAPLQPGAPRNEELSVNQGGYVNYQQFENFAKNFKGADGRFVAMTAYGAVPVPENVMKEIPEEFVTAPKYEETETFVLKKKHHDRITQKPFTQHEHHFVEVVKKGQLEKLIPAGEEKKITIPKYFYKAIIAENIIEVPQGTKYTETPIDVHMRHPPKLIPQRKAIIVNRNIECTKPVVQEKIIEKPKIVKRSVPKVVTKEIPFVVPKYVEKIIEVPYRPGLVLPPATGDVNTAVPECPSGTFGPFTTEPAGAPSGHPSPAPPGSPFAGSPFAPGPHASPGFVDMPPGARVEGSTLYMPADADPNRPQTVYLPPGVKEIKVPFEAKIDVSVVQAEDRGSVALQQEEGGLPNFHYHPSHILQGSSGHPAMMQQTPQTMQFQNAVQFAQRQHQQAATVNQQQQRNTRSSGATHSSYNLRGNERMSASSGPRGTTTVNGDGDDDRSEMARYYEEHPDADPNQFEVRCCGVPLPQEAVYGDIPMPPPPPPLDPNAAYAVPMDPVVIHDVPGMKNVKYRKQGREPQVLTQHGVAGLSRVSSAGVPCYNVPPEQLLPPLQQVAPVPLQRGQLNLHELERIQEDFRSKMNPSLAEAMAAEAAAEAAKKQPSHSE